RRGHFLLHRPLSHSRIEYPRMGTLQGQHPRCSPRKSRSRPYARRSPPLREKPPAQNQSGHAHRVRRLLLRPQHPRRSHRPGPARPPPSHQLEILPRELQYRYRPHRNRRSDRHRRLLPHRRRRQTLARPPIPPPRRPPRRPRPLTSSRRLTSAPPCPLAFLGVLRVKQLLKQPPNKESRIPLSPQKLHRPVPLLF